MFDRFERLNKFFVRKLRTESYAMMIQTKFLVSILIGCVIWMCAVSVNGAVTCFVDDQNPMKDVINEYCAVDAKYTCAKNSSGCFDTSNVGKTSISHFQWIPLYLLLQAAVFHLPGYLWNRFEGGLMKKICGDLDLSFGKPSWENKMNEIYTYFGNSRATKANQTYYYRYMLCEISTVAVAILNCLLLEIIIPNGLTGPIQGVFIGHISAFLQSTFPLLASCEFPHKEINDTVTTTYECILSHNAIYQQVFVVVFISIVIYLVCCLIIIFDVIWTHYGKVIWTQSCKCKCGCKGRKHEFNKYLDSPMNSDHSFFQPGNFFVLNLIKTNINEVVFTALLNGLVLRSHTENAPLMGTVDSCL